MAVTAAKIRFLPKAKGLNKSVVYVGSKTGRDGIHELQWLRQSLTKIRSKNQQYK